MDFELRPATKEDYSGLLSIVEEVWGLDDFITGLFRGWITNTSENYPIIVSEKASGEYVAIGNIKKIGDYAWLEGLRIRPKFRGQKLANKMTEELINAPIILKECSKVGYATGNENYAMHNVAKSFGFEPLGQQMVLKKVFTEEQLEKNKKNILFPSEDKKNFHAFIKEKYPTGLFTSFSKIPENEVGKNLLEKTPVYESTKSFLLYEKYHNERTATRGIFTIYLKKDFSFETLLNEIQFYEPLVLSEGFKVCSFSTPVEKSKIDSLMDYCKNLAGFESHFLVFFEKKM